MQEVFQIIGNWQNTSQFFFFLIIFFGTTTLIRSLAYYVAVSIKGWPDQNFEEIEEEDGEG